MENYKIKFKNKINNNHNNNLIIIIIIITLYTIKKNYNKK